MGAKPFRIAIVQATYHEQELKVMLAAARDEARELGIEVARVLSVPGSMEIPLLIDTLLAQDDINGGVALGVIEKGETAHGRVMGDAVVKTLLEIELARRKPIGTAILGPEIELSQVPPRLERYSRNAVRAVHALMAQL